MPAPLFHKPNVDVEAVATGNAAENAINNFSVNRNLKGNSITIALFFYYIINNRL
jgi:hypothetical protein